MYFKKPDTKSISIHKWIGYIFIPILIVHPFFIVLPRFFEGGIEPVEAFWVMITTFNSKELLLV